MATILRASDPRFKRDVAIKLLPREFQHERTFRTRFEREAETIAALEHPAIVPVYDYGEEDDQPYFVMRYMPGGSLADKIAKGPLPVAEAARIVARIAPALDTAHTHRIIHRDLKPANILFDQYHEPYISDFGIAKIAEAGRTLTATAMTIGTPDYMSPEQAQGEGQLDGRSDVYALGIMLFEMLTGNLPYVADTPLGIAYKHVNEPLPHVLDKKPTLPPGCQTVVEKATAKQRGDRYPTARALAEALAAVAQTAAAPPRNTTAILNVIKPVKGKTAADKRVKGKTLADKPAKGKAAPGKIVKDRARAAPRGVDTEALTMPLPGGRATVAPALALRNALGSAARLLKRRIWIVPLGMVGVCLLLGLVGAAAALRLAVPGVTVGVTPGATVPLPGGAAVITVDNAHLRAGPGTEFAPMAIVNKGDQFEIRGRSEDSKWLAVILPEDGTGWVAVNTVDTAADIERLTVIRSLSP